MLNIHIKPKELSDHPEQGLQSISFIPFPDVVKNQPYEGQYSNHHFKYCEWTDYIIRVVDLYLHENDFDMKKRNFAHRSDCGMRLM